MNKKPETSNQPALAFTKGRPGKPELVVATRNKKKLEEIKYLLKDLRINILSLKDFKNAPNVKEDGSSFIENAKKKAVQIARFTHRLTLGEDSGLQVDYLGGRPGIYSSRFSGNDKSDLKNNLKILRLLGKLSPNKRGARYQCAIVLADAKGVVRTVEGSCYGRIGFELIGKSGFGYDPLFIVSRYKKTFAQVSPLMKHKISHRGRAVRKLRSFLLDYFKKDLPVS